MKEMLEIQTLVKRERGRKEEKAAEPAAMGCVAPTGPGPPVHPTGPQKEKPTDEHIRANVRE